MMGTAPPHVLGRLKKIRRQRRSQQLAKFEAILPAVHLAAGCLLTTGVPRIELSARFKGKLFEFKSLEDTDFTKWGDVYGYVDSSGRNRKGIAHQVVEKGEFGGRLAADIYDFTSRKRAAAESARVGKFKITENSPNTARITVGPDQRQRRKKYVWERVGFQRVAATIATAGAIAGTAALHSKLASIGDGSAKTGLRNLFRKVAYEGRKTAAKIAGTETKIKPFEPEKGPIAKLADIAARRTEGTKKGQASKLAVYGEKPVLVPDVHPPGHPQEGQPVGYTKTGKPKKKLVPRSKSNITGISGEQMPSAG